MKLKLQLLTLILAFTCLNACSQTLYNTLWGVYSSPGVLFYYFSFGTDTVKYSPDKITYTPNATFKVNGNNYSEVDLFPNCGPDTAKYTFAIQNDTLKFTLVADTCSNRAAAHTTYFWVGLPTGLQSLESTPSVLLYPNPVTDGIVHLSLPESHGFNLVSIYSMDGKKVFEENIPGSSNPEINLKNLSGGVYILKANSNEKQYMQKLIIE